MPVRKWCCKRKLHGYVLELSYGDVDICTFIDSFTVSKALSVNSLFEYHIIQLNSQLQKAIFPLARSLDEDHLKMRYI